MLIIPFKIMEKTWELRILPNKKYHKKRGKDSLGQTLSWKRRIDLHKSAVSFNDESSLELIVHELLHAYLGEMCVQSTENISNDDFEEIYAELLAKRGKELLALADHLLDEVKKYIVYE